MAEGGFFVQAFVYLLAAVISVPIAQRLGLGSVLGYLIAGIVIGPFVLGLVGDEGQDLMHFAEFGVVMMLFLIGLELQPRRLWRMRTPILGLGGCQVLVTAVLFAAIGISFGLVWQVALAVGLTLALSSTAIVLQTLQEKRLMGTDSGQRSFAVLLFQDIAVIPMLALLPLLATLAVAGHDAHGSSGHGSETWISQLPPWGNTLVVVAAVALIVFGGRVLLRPLLRFVARTRLRESFTATALLLVVGIALLMEQVGLSPALGTFLAGVVLADSEYRHELESNVEPFKGLLLGLFFIAVGASIDFHLIAADPGKIALLVGLLMGVKWLVLLGLGRVFRMGLDQNLLFAVALAQGGEFAFVLLSFATQNGVVGNELASTLIAVVALSMALTPLALLFHEKILQPRVGTKTEAHDEPEGFHEVNPVIICGFGDFGNVVGRFLRANGVGCTVFEDDSDRVEILRKLNIKAFYGDASRIELLELAGIEHAQIVVIALDDHDKALEISRALHTNFPHVRVLARAHGRVQAYEFLEAGVQYVYRETLDTSLQMGVDALRWLGARGYHAHRSARVFRRHDERALRELSTMRHDQPQYMNRARELIAQIEGMLSQEVDHEEELRKDEGWDARSLRSTSGDED